MSSEDSTVASIESPKTKRSDHRFLPRALSIETAQSQQVRARSGTLDSPRSLSPRVSGGSQIGPIIPNRSPRTPKSSSGLEDSGSNSPRISPKISPQQSPRSQRTSSLGGPSLDHQPSALTPISLPPAASADGGVVRSASQQGISPGFKRRTMHIHSSSGGSYDLAKLKSMLQDAEGTGAAESAASAATSESRSRDNVQRSKSNARLSRSLSGANISVAAQVLVNPAMIVFESQIYKQNRARRWKKRWMVLTSRNLIFYKHKDKDPSSAKIVELIHCTARECERNIEATGSSNTSSEIGSATSFEILSPDGKRHVLCGSTDGEAAVWLGMLQKVLDALLDEAIHTEEQKSSAKRNTTSGLPQALLNMIVTIPECAACADCGCADPDWASVTFGSFICIQCSGIHRSIGRNLSVVRSIMYDNWDEPSIDAMKGNKVVNQFWEKFIPEGVNKPLPQSPEEEKNSWIVRKYIKREFVDPSASRRDYKAVLFTPHGAKAWLDQSDEFLRTIEQMQQQLLPSSSSNAAPITPNLILARQTSAADVRSNPASILISTGVGKKSKKEKREKRDRAASTSAIGAAAVAGTSSPSSSTTATPRRETAAALKYMSNPNLLKEALLYLITEDEHFKRQLRTLLREPT